MVAKNYFVMYYNNVRTKGDKQMNKQEQTKELKKMLSGWVERIQDPVYDNESKKVYYDEAVKVLAKILDLNRVL